MVNETIKLEFKGKIRELRFGIGPSRILCEDKGISLSDFQNLGTSELIQDMICAAIKFDCLLSEQAVDFTKWEVYQWINDMDQTTFQKIFDVFIKTKVIGKSVYDAYIQNLEMQKQGDKDTEGDQNEKKNRPGMT